LEWRGRENRGRGRGWVLLTGEDAAVAADLFVVVCKGKLVREVLDCARVEGGGRRLLGLQVIIRSSVTVPITKIKYKLIIKLTA
jgi:hypothetical protein